MWQTFNELKNLSKTSDLTLTDAFQLNLSEINGNLEWSSCGSSFRSCWDLLTRWLPKSVLKQELPGIQVTTYSGVTNFRKNKTMKSIFSSKMPNILCRFCKCNNNFKKVFLVLKIIVFELVAKISLKSSKKRCDWSSTCWKTVLRFQIWLRQMLFDWICLRLMEN